jgi:hypothetical protein
MIEYLTTCPKLLGLLEGFYRTTPAHPPLDAVIVQPVELPKPHYRLLVHDKDMTSTLTDHHREKIVLRVLQQTVAGDRLSRHIVLEIEDTREPVEYGASRIELSVLDDRVRSKVIEGSEPLGGILNDHGVAYNSCPGAFFKVRSNDLMNGLFALVEPHWLYGRCNCLTDRGGRTIAEVVEILPPHNDD